MHPAFRKQSRTDFYRVSGTPQQCPLPIIGLIVTIGISTELRTCCFSVRGYGTDQPTRLAVDPFREVERIRTTVAAADPELDCPKTAREVAADVDVNCPTQLPAGRVEGVDLAMEIAEVANQQIAGEPPEAGRRQGNTPGRSEPTAGDQLFDEVAVFIENRDGPRTQWGVGLGGASGGRIGHVHVAADV